MVRPLQKAIACANAFAKYSLASGVDPQDEAKRGDLLPRRGDGVDFKTVRWPAQAVSAH